MSNGNTKKLPNVPGYLQLVRLSISSGPTIRFWCPFSSVLGKVEVVLAHYFAG